MDYHFQNQKTEDLNLKKRTLTFNVCLPPCRPKRLKQFLQEEKLYTFVSFSIGGDKQMLNKSGLEINPNNFIDMQRKWKVPTKKNSTTPWPMLQAASSTHPTKA